MLAYQLFFQKNSVLCGKSSNDFCKKGELLCDKATVRCVKGLISKHLFQEWMFGGKELSYSSTVKSPNCCWKPFLSTVFFPLDKMASYNDPDDTSNIEQCITDQKTQASKFFTI